jgi:hypothetical protein
MTQQPRNITIIDPRTLDGDPYEVAEKAALQAQALVRLATQATKDAEAMARTAEMERNLVATKGSDAKASEWDTSPQGKRFSQVDRTLMEQDRALGRLSKAVRYNPKKPPRE